jgi:hypothetical protein
MCKIIMFQIKINQNDVKMWSSNHSYFPRARPFHALFNISWAIDFTLRKNCINLNENVSIITKSDIQVYNYVLDTGILHII